MERKRNSAGQFSRLVDSKPSPTGSKCSAGCRCGRHFRNPTIPASARYIDSSGRPQVHYGNGVFIDNERYPLDWAACGTRKNYKAHLRRGQQSCKQCLKAERNKL